LPWRIHTPLCAGFQSAFRTCRGPRPVFAAAVTAAPFAALLLAGGRSERMGTDKARLLWQGQPLWRLQLAKLAALGPARLLVACREAQGLHAEAPVPACEWCFDPPGSDDGPLGAIARSLVELPLLVLAVDLPCFEPAALLAEWRALAAPERGLCWRSAQGLEPLAAVYGPLLRPALQQALAARRLGLQKLLADAAAQGALVVRPAPAQAGLDNVNTPEEWARRQKGGPEGSP
jgi:molybdopterin-guanine dinucleotide biosynthesis protein A